MDLKTAEAAIVYIEIIYNVNRRIIKLKKLNFDNFTYMLQRIALEVVSDIPRLIPMKQFENEPLRLVNNNGILKFRKQFPYIEITFNKLITENKKSLQTIRTIRNKIEHAPHALKFKNSLLSADSINFTIDFDIKKNNKTERLVLDSNEIIEIVTQLNIVFDKLVKEVRNFAKNNYTENNQTYKYLTKIKLLNFNKIYNKEKNR